MENEESAIRAVLDAYVTGFNRADKSMLMRSFHPKFVSSGFVNDELQWDSADEFASFCEAAAPDPDGPVPDWHLEHLAVSGRTAVAVIRDQWGDREFRDILTLLKDGGSWRIVFKAFHGLG